MAEYLYLMRADTVTGAMPEQGDWTTYIDRLVSAGALRGGSAMGGGACFRKSGDVPDISAHITGYIKIEADSLEAARALLVGNPVYEAGGVVEIRDLPRTD